MQINTNLQFFLNDTGSSQGFQKLPTLPQELKTEQILRQDYKVKTILFQRYYEHVALQGKFDDSWGDNAPGNKTTIFQIKESK